MPLKTPSQDSAAIIREFCKAANYTEQGIAKMFGGDELPMPNATNLPAMLDRTAQMTTENLLVRWFLMGVAIPSPPPDVIPMEFLQACLTTGLLREEENGIVSDFMMVPCGDLYIVSDAYKRLHSAEFFDHVLTVNPTARHLLNFTIRRPFGKVLDLCAGCGIHGLMTARHAGSVVMTDLNPRAIEFASLNAALNGINNVEFLTGSGFAPVADRKYDLIVCNPPFVLAPSKEFLYRDNELDLDQFCRHLVERAGDHLNPGGFFQMICEWVQVTGQAWQDRIRQWCEATGCDVWVLKANTQLPENYAQSRIREMREGGGPVESDYETWIEYYRSQNVRGIHGGLIAMRKRDGKNWIRFEELSEGIRSGFGHAVQTAFEAQDFLAENSTSEQVLETQPRLSEGLVLAQEFGVRNGEWTPNTTQLRVVLGLPQVIEFDEDFAVLLPKFDGSRSVRMIHEEFAERIGVLPSRSESEFINVIRQLIERGILLT